MRMQLQNGSAMAARDSPNFLESTQQTSKNIQNDLLEIDLLSDDTRVDGKMKSE